MQERVELSNNSHIYVSPSYCKAMFKEGLDTLITLGWLEEQTEQFLQLQKRWMKSLDCPQIDLKKQNRSVRLPREIRSVTNTFLSLVHHKVPGGCSYQEKEKSRFFELPWNLCELHCFLRCLFRMYLAPEEKCDKFFMPFRLVRFIQMTFRSDEKHWLGAAVERNCASGLKLDKQHCKCHVTQIITYLKKSQHKNPSKSPENIQ